jgi:hypothetical protein
MLTVIVQFPLPGSIGPEQFREFCRSVAADFQKPEGLLRKTFLMGEDGRSAGGVYQWRSRADADRFYGAGFRAMVAERFEAEPIITCYSTPVVVDNVTGKIELT